MKKRSRASKDAMTELFSNSTDEIKYSETNGIRTNSKREELAKQFFGTSVNQSLSGEAAIVSRAATDTSRMTRGKRIAPLQESRAKSVTVNFPDRTQVINKVSPRSTAAGDKKALSNTRTFGTVHNTSNTARAAEQTAQMTRVDIPAARAAERTAQMTRVDIPAARAAEQTAQMTRVDIPAARAAERTAQMTRVDIPTARAAERTAQMTRVDIPAARAKQKGVKRKKTLRIAIVTVLMSLFLAVSVTAAVYLFPQGDDFVPADISAGAEESLAVPSLLSDTTAQYLTESRFAVTFQFYESPEITCTTPEMTVGELMDKLGITVNENNRMYVSLDDKITENCTIAIDTLSYETAYSTESVAYETEYEDIRTIPKGTTSVKVNGKNGVKTYTYKCTLVNGVEESREVVGEEITTKPTTQVLYRGIGGTVTSQGKTYSYSYYIDVSATTYNIVGTTATGRATSESVIAVDPSVIPLNTACVVMGSYGDFGYRIAADTGGSIKGNKIDIWLPAGSAYSGNFGWRSMRVYILE